MSDPAVEQILAYLREHAGAYPPGQLRDQLIAAGYRATDVDVAQARLGAERAEPPARPPVTDATIALPTADRPDMPLHRALAYIEQNRDSYDEQALRGALERAGYPAAVVDEAIRRAAPAPRQRGPRAWPLGLLVAVLNYGLLGVMAFAELAVLDNLVLTGVLALALPLGEVAAWLALRRGPRARLGRSLLLGALFSVGGVLLGGALGALLIGICIAALYGGG
jgi:hypothetical protein